MYHLCVQTCILVIIEYVCVCKRVYWLLSNMYVCANMLYVYCLLFIKGHQVVWSLICGVFFQICCVVLDLLCFFDVLESSLQFSRAD